eukprot:4986319-Prymnesium_polylepis.1
MQSALDMTEEAAPKAPTAKQVCGGGGTSNSRSPHTSHRVSSPLTPQHSTALAPTLAAHQL